MQSSSILNRPLLLAVAATTSLEAGLCRADAPVEPVCGYWGYLKGDLDENCVLDFADLAILAKHWLMCTDPLGSECINCDDLANGECCYTTEGTLEPALTEPVPLSAGPHLFIDDYLIDNSEGLVRTTHQPVKLPEPILTNDDGIHEQVMWYLKILPYDDGFRMWYVADFGDGPWDYGYAESTDGLNWQLPDLGLYPVAGNVVKLNAYCLLLVDHGPDWPNPPKRYVMMYKGGGGFHGAYSPDGIHWHDDPNNPLYRDHLYRMSDRLSGCWDPLRNSYLLTCGYAGKPEDGFVGKPPHNAEGYRRMVGQMTSSDGVSWNPFRPIVVEDPEKSGFWETYGMTPRVRGKLYLGFLRVLRDDLPADEGGVLRTRLFKWDADHITVNANVNGELRVRLLAESHLPLRGFFWSDCDPITGDLLAHPVRWDGVTASLKGKRVRLEFSLSDAEVYGFETESYPLINSLSIDFGGTGQDVAENFLGLGLDFSDRRPLIGFNDSDGLPPGVTVGIEPTNTNDDLQFNPTADGTGALTGDKVLPDNYEGGLRLSITGLEPNDYTLTSYHNDPAKLKSDFDVYVDGALKSTGNPQSDVYSDVLAAAVTTEFTLSGQDNDVVLEFVPTSPGTGGFNRVSLNGFTLSRTR
jgi:hypothetical protein